jgi:hypothetical protein
MAEPQQKIKRFESRTLLNFASGRACVLCEQIGLGSDETTVPAHLPGSYYGMPAGTGQKTHDWLVAHLCHKHHEMMDGPWRKDTEMRMKALCLTLQRLFAEGRLVVSSRQD